MNASIVCGNGSLQGVQYWHKTEIPLISTSKGEERISLTRGECEIQSQPQLKYLGVIIDSKLTFKEHLALRVMANKAHVRSSRRFLLAKVMRSVVLYPVTI